MANLTTSMDAAFGDLNISSPRAIDGVSKAIPGDTVPLDGARASRAFRMQQLSLLRGGFPLGIIPSYSASTNQEELGSFALQSLLGRATIGDWWFGLVGQLRPKKLISSIKAKVSAAEEWNPPLLKEVAKQFLDKSLYATGLSSQITLTSSSSLLLSNEKHGDRKRPGTKAMLFHKLPDHDITFEAAWPELFIDHRGKYWEVPESISLDCSSLVSDSGLRYRLGIRKNSGHPQAVDSVSSETPQAILPGICAKAAFSYEKSKDLWRPKETKHDTMTETEKDQIRHLPYDIRLKEPHSALSGIIGGTCEACLSGGKGLLFVDPRQDVERSYSTTKDRFRFGADLFGSLCYTFQHGKFRNLFGDLTRVDARLDVNSASALAKKLSSPKLNLIFQQQVAGPIVFRVDSKFMLGSSHKPELEDVMYSLNCSLRFLGSGKVVAWFSPKRNEGMVELRVFEF